MAKRAPDKIPSRVRAEKQFHQDQRSAFGNLMRSNGLKKINQETRDEIGSTYGVRANGQTLKKFEEQLAEKEKAIRADAQRARQESRSSGTTRGNPSPKPLGNIGSGPKSIKPASKGGTPVDRSEAVKRAWATRRKNYGDTGRKK